MLAMAESFQKIERTVVERMMRGDNGTPSCLAKSASLFLIYPL